MRADASLISRTRPSASNTVTMSGQARITVSSRRWRSASAVWTRVHSVMSVAMAAMPLIPPDGVEQGEPGRHHGVVAVFEGHEVVAGEDLTVIEHTPVGVVDGRVGPDLAHGLSQDVLALEPEGAQEHLVDHHVALHRVLHEDRGGGVVEDRREPRFVGAEGGSGRRGGG